jgi:AAA+ superfamily predicted ATPase
LGGDAYGLVIPPKFEERVNARPDLLDCVGRRARIRHQCSSPSPRRSTISFVSNEGLIGSLEAAVSASPNDVPLRLHLAAMLCDIDEPQRALEHVSQVLASQPSQREALSLAARAATALGLPERADAYRELLNALDQAANAPSSGQRIEVANLAFGGDAESDDDGDEFDDFLRDVSAEAEADLERETVTLADVGGLEAVKRQLQVSFIGPMQNPSLRRMYGKSLRGGLLMYGPPGCGKTFLARAVAGEIGAHFYAVGLHEVLDMYLGQSERNLHAVFETARRNTPCVLFLDEVDALGMKRSNLARSAGRNVVVQLLAELDGMHDDNEGIFVLGATNQPWDLDPALRRPGRFDRILLVLPPDHDARAAIVRYHLSTRPVGSVDVDAIARRTEGYSGADLRLVTEDAAERALQDSISTGIARPLEQADFDAAIKHVRPSTKPWFDAARSFVMFANQSGEYDQLLDYMRAHKLA